MKIEFIGGARTVTGSQFLLHINGKKILLECGLFQGRRSETYEKNMNFSFDPASLDVMLLSHAHIDHSGNIPNLIKKGFQGSIYATSATVSLCQIMLRDSAHLQQLDIEFINKKRKKKGEATLEPLYSLEDVEKSLIHFIGVQYNRPIKLLPGITATFRDAGHILGSAGIQLNIEESNGKEIRFGFSGDIGRENSPLMKAPDILRDLDFLIMESTYANRIHSNSFEAEDELASVINNVVNRGGKIIIPAFAVGRTQTLVYMLHKLYNENRIPSIPIYVDSPLAFNATNVFRANPDCLDRETYRIFLVDGIDPFGFDKLKYIKTTEESKKLNSATDPMIIISASGMAEGGRILHHLKNNIGNPKNLVLIVGYAAKNTLARKLQDGEKEVKIFGETFSVNCSIKTIDYFSAHADQNELLKYLTFNPPERLKNLFLVHGEEQQVEPFIEKLKQRGYKNINFPATGDIIKI